MNQKRFNNLPNFHLSNFISFYTIRYFFLLSTCVSIVNVQNKPKAYVEHDNESTSKSDSKPTHYSIAWFVTLNFFVNGYWHRLSNALKAKVKQSVKLFFLCVNLFVLACDRRAIVCGVHVTADTLSGVLNGWYESITNFVTRLFLSIFEWESNETPHLRWVKVQT